ncbi:MAG: DUF1080 domain-containing protein, partial [Acidobacteria bacterium]|nr:DUF1080 domain-containing protein [Acidobacteriota bacterium]
MPRFASRLFLLSILLVPSMSLAKSSPFVGRWGFNLTTPNGATRGAWLGITEKAGQLEVWYQPTGGNVYQLKDFKVEGTHLSLTLSKASANRPATTWELDAANGKLRGAQKRGDATQKLTGLAEPALKRKAPKAWTAPTPLFNGKDLTGWEPIGDPANSHWVAKDGLLLNQDHGANLKTTRR